MQLLRLKKGPILAHTFRHDYEQGGKNYTARANNTHMIQQQKTRGSSIIITLHVLTTGRKNKGTAYLLKELTFTVSPNFTHDDGLYHKSKNVQKYASIAADTP